ncbi:unnamed protein product [Rotaria sp. Silwood1]|nr:unnamed protein product [Rotaria sp. Silwood1]
MGQTSSSSTAAGGKKTWTMEDDDLIDTDELLDENDRKKPDVKTKEKQIYANVSNDCQSYYECLITPSGKQITVSRKCPTPLIYSEDKKRCMKEKELSDVQIKCSTKLRIPAAPIASTNCWDPSSFNQLENLQQDAIEQLITNYMATPEHSSFNENDLESLLKPTVQRRFCCMSPLSGRKRFIRDLARKQ